MKQGTNQAGPGGSPPDSGTFEEGEPGSAASAAKPANFLIEDEPSGTKHLSPPSDFLLDESPPKRPPPHRHDTPPLFWAAMPEPRAAPASLDFALLRGALEEIPLGVATTRSGQILYANAALERLYGAPPGGLEDRHVAVLFDQQTFLRISHLLDEKRVFDGRVRTRGLDGRSIDAEVHAEWYSSAALGIGGFLVFRDVGFELGALGRIIDQLGGALFRIRTDDGMLEYTSPTVSKLLGIEATTCIEHPVLLTSLVSSEERERLMFLYRRVAAGEIASASAQVSVRRADGRVRVIQIRGTGRRDTAGIVRHIDGVATDMTREAQETAYAAAMDAPPLSRPTRRKETANLAPAVLELTQELLREASQHLHALGRSIGLAQLDGRGQAEVADRLEGMARSFAATSSLNRRVRHALAGTATSAPVGHVLEQVRATLEPVIGADVISFDAGTAAMVVIEQRVDELTLVLTWLALRAFRFSGSGTLRLEACRAAPPPPDPRARPRGVAPTSETQDTLLTILGTAPPDSSMPGVEVSSELQAVHRRDEGDHAYAAAKIIIAAAGGSIEADDVTLEEACTVIRLKG